MNYNYITICVCVCAKVCQSVMRTSGRVSDHRADLGRAHVCQGVQGQAAVLGACVDVCARVLIARLSRGSPNNWQSVSAVVKNTQ